MFVNVKKKTNQDQDVSTESELADTDTEAHELTQILVPHEGRTHDAHCTPEPFREECRHMALTLTLDGIFCFSTLRLTCNLIIGRPPCPPPTDVLLIFFERFCQ